MAFFTNKLSPKHKNPLLQQNIFCACIPVLMRVSRFRLQLFSTFCKIFLDRKSGVVIFGIIE